MVFMEFKINLRFRHQTTPAIDATIMPRSFRNCLSLRVPRQYIPSVGRRCQNPVYSISLQKSVFRGPEMHASKLLVLSGERPPKEREYPHCNQEYA
jgi:hypothetical protein